MKKLNEIVKYSKTVSIVLFCLCVILYSCDGEKKECTDIKITEIIFSGFNYRDTNSIKICLVDNLECKNEINGHFKLDLNKYDMNFILDNHIRVHNSGKILIKVDSTNIYLDSIKIDNVAHRDMFNTHYFCEIIDYKLNNCKILRTNSIIIRKDYIDKKSNYNYWTEKEIDF